MRKFRHKNGFSDSTDYIEVVNGESFFIEKNGQRISCGTSWPLSECIKMTEGGYWIEIMDKEQINKKINETQETIRLAQKQLETLKEELNKASKIEDFKIGDVFVASTMSKCIVAPANYAFPYKGDVQKYIFLGLSGLMNYSNHPSGATKEQILAGLNYYKDVRKIGNVNEAVNTYLASVN